MKKDLSPRVIQQFRVRYQIPEIPNLSHWFRNYVVVDLARLRLAILGAPISPRSRDFFLACFLSIIRSASNADPIPVSGLEVTSHMRKLEAKGRRIDPFTLFYNRAARSIAGMGEFYDSAANVNANVRKADATKMRVAIRPRSVDVVITSPPYNLAVDYFRRHTLETYWLNPAMTQIVRANYGRSYIGRAGIRKGNRRLNWVPQGRYLEKLLQKLDANGNGTGRAFRHYAASMQLVLDNLALVLRKNGKAIIVVGNAKWGGLRVHPTRVIEKLATKQFVVAERLSYPIQTPKVPHTSIGSFVLDAYRYAMNTGQQACSLDYLEDAAWAGWQAYSSDGQVRRLLESAHQRYPRNVRFHVDRQGKRAFIFLDEVAAAALADGFE